MKKELVYLNDKVVKKVFNSEGRECREYLVRIISTTTGIDINDLRNNIELVTPEINSNKNFVESTVDSIYKTKDKYFNIEINYNNSLVARVKNSTYLYNAILRQIDNNKKYNSVLPVIQININNFDIYKEDRFVYETKMLETKIHKIRDELITIYDINLEKLKEIDYNEIKKGKSYNLEKLLYIFVCNDKDRLDKVYIGDEIMNKVREKCNDYIKVLDDMLYYNEEDLQKQIIEYETEQARKRGYESGHQAGMEAGIFEKTKETVNLMINKGFKDEIIKDVLNINDKILSEIKSELEL